MDAPALNKPFSTLSERFSVSDEEILITSKIFFPQRAGKEDVSGEALVFRIGILNNVFALQFILSH